MPDDLEVGPVDYLVVEFPGDRRTGEGLPILVDLVDRGIIRILDLVFVKKDLDGVVGVVELSAIDGEFDVDLMVFDGVSSGLVGEDDVAGAGGVIEPGSAAAILVYENTWAAPFVGAMRRSGADVVASGRIPADDLLATIASLES